MGATAYRRKPWSVASLARPKGVATRGARLACEAVVSKIATRSFSALYSRVSFTRKKSAAKRSVFHAVDLAHHGLASEATLHGWRPISASQARQRSTRASRKT